MLWLKRVLTGGDILCGIYRGVLVCVLTKSSRTESSLNMWLFWIRDGECNKGSSLRQTVHRGDKSSAEVFYFAHIKPLLNKEEIPVTSQILLWPSAVDPAIRYSGDGNSKAAFPDGWNRQKPKWCSLKFLQVCRKQWKECRWVTGPALLPRNSRNNIAWGLWQGWDAAWIVEKAS